MFSLAMIRARLSDQLTETARLRLEHAFELGTTDKPECSIVMSFKHRPTILLVEDEALVRVFASDIIKACGADVIEARDALEAIHILKANNGVNLLFTDLNMPGAIDGFELLETVHHMRPEVELIMTSARETYSDDALPDHATFLPKPYLANELCKTLKEKLSKFA